ncbi:hypothetical protein [Rhizobium sp.]|uniref:hypothetical protein n=1 Tax=Rhizobium sp. TaxID=391 RepID=UPI003F806CB7
MSSDAAKRELFRIARDAGGSCRPRFLVSEARKSFGRNEVSAALQSALERGQFYLDDEMRLAIPDEVGI